MSFLVEQTRDVDVGGGNVVTIRKMTFHTRQQILSRHSKLDMQTKAVETDHAMIRYEQLSCNIVRWTGPDFDGFGMTEENIRMLPVDVADTILEAIDDFNTISESEKKP